MNFNLSLLLVCLCIKSSRKSLFLFFTYGGMKIEDCFLWKSGLIYFWLEWLFFFLTFIWSSRIFSSFCT